MILKKLINRATSFYPLYLLLLVVGCNNNDNPSSQAEDIEAKDMTAFMFVNEMLSYSGSVFDNCFELPRSRITTTYYYVICDHSLYGRVEISYKSSFDYSAHNANPKGISGTAQQGINVPGVPNIETALAFITANLSPTPKDIVITDDSPQTLSVIADRDTNGNLVNLSTLAHICIEGLNTRNTRVSNGIVDLVAIQGSNTRQTCFTVDNDHLPTTGGIYTGFTATNSDREVTTLDNFSVNFIYNPLGGPTVSAEDVSLSPSYCIQNSNGIDKIVKIASCKISIETNATSANGIYTMSLTYNGHSGEEVIQAYNAGVTDIIALMVNGDTLRYRLTATDFNGLSRSTQGEIALAIPGQFSQPRQTTIVYGSFNLDATEPVLYSNNIRYFSSGNTASANNNSYPAQSLAITDPDGITAIINTTLNDNSQTIANSLNAVTGASANASAQAIITRWNNGLTLSINGTQLINTNISQTTATEINNLAGLSATYDGTAHTISVQSSVGDLLFRVTGGGADGDLLTVNGATSGTQTIERDAAADGVSVINLDADTASIVVGGVIQLELNQGYSLTDSSLDPIFNNPGTLLTINGFNPNNSSTYNHSTSSVIYDSLGTPHTLALYFVKQYYDANKALASNNRPNHWRMIVTIDNTNVGEPLITAPTTPTLATYNIFFAQNGELDNILIQPILISNWTPTSNGAQAMGPATVAAGFSLPIPQPPTSSNFIIDLQNTTQFSQRFTVKGMIQDGYPRGGYLYRTN